jgi:hypothetical protein
VRVARLLLYAPLHLTYSSHFAVNHAGREKDLVRLRQNVDPGLPVWRKVLSVQFPITKGSDRLFYCAQVRDLPGGGLQYGPRRRL